MKVVELVSIFMIYQYLWLLNMKKNG